VTGACRRLEENLVDQNSELEPITQWLKRLDAFRLPLDPSVQLIPMSSTNLDFRRISILEGFLGPHHDLDTIKSHDDCHR